MTTKGSSMGFQVSICGSSIWSLRSRDNMHLTDVNPVFSFTQYLNLILIHYRSVNASVEVYS